MLKLLLVIFIKLFSSAEIKNVILLMNIWYLWNYFSISNQYELTEKLAKPLVGFSLSNKVYKTYSIFCNDTLST